MRQSLRSDNDFFFNDTATTEIYTLSLHDALPIYGDWTSDGTGANLNHSGNPDPSVHGGANFHLRVTGTDVTTNSADRNSTPLNSRHGYRTHAVSPPQTNGGGTLKGQYWKRPVNSI